MANETIKPGSKPSADPDTKVGDPNMVDSEKGTVAEILPGDERKYTAQVDGPRKSWDPEDGTVAAHAANIRR